MVTPLLTPVIFPNTQESDGTELSVSQKRPRENFALESYPSELCCVHCKGQLWQRSPKPNHALKDVSEAAQRGFCLCAVGESEQATSCSRSGFWGSFKKPKEIRAFPLTPLSAIFAHQVSISLWSGSWSRKFSCSSSAQSSLSRVKDPGYPQHSSPYSYPVSRIFPPGPPFCSLFFLRPLWEHSFFKPSSAVQDPTASVLPLQSVYKSPTSASQSAGLV